MTPAAPAGPSRWCRSTARTRPASRRRSRRTCTSPPSTSPPSDVDGLRSLLQDWTDAARALTAGRPVGDGAVGGSPLAPPDDTGEALDVTAHRLTLTVGFGASLFDDRFGLASRRPEALVDLPHFPGDVLDPARSDGDLVVQACADDPQVAVHAIRNLSRIAAGRAAIRWAQLGYGKAASTDRSQPTPRNLFGFKDGTANPSGTDTATLDEHVWVAPDDAAVGRRGAGWPAAPTSSPAGSRC